MSDVMMKALQVQNESLICQVERLGPENERVRKLLTEFDNRHNADTARIADLERQLAEAQTHIQQLTAAGDAMDGWTSDAHEGASIAPSRWSEASRSALHALSRETQT
ncbi:hypothetical protein [Ponticoccus litoralis]|uniref:Uncharacterized protein n=1 Tax=Ponticoccus litoralis TaxID=422297 RepID=A0AAW9SFM9_9RHOB